MKCVIIYKRLRGTIFFYAMMVALLSCNEYTDGIQYSLEKAGDDKSDLIKLLKHYSHKPEDSLKLKAAKFIIENIPYHSFYEPLTQYNSAFDSIQKYPASVLRRDVFENLLDSVNRKAPIKNKQQVLDIDFLTADFLIDNIELSFKAWNRIPKSKRASFNDFREYILPYRNSNEPLEYGIRKELLNQYSWVYKLMEDGASLKRIVDTVTSGFGYVNMTRMRRHYPVPLSMGQIKKSRIGLCDDGVNYFVNVFRALGIVCAKDMINHWGNHHSSGHSWIYLKYGNEEYSTNISGGVNLNEKFNKESIPKVRRATYSRQKYNIFSPLTIDVTKHYVPTININVENVLNASDVQPILCVFDVTDGWAPISIGEKEANHFTYTDIGVNVLYLSASFIDGRIIPSNYPFFINGNEKLHFFRPEKNKIMDSVLLTRKYGLSSPRNKSKVKWLTSLNGGVFEASNTQGFKNPKKLYQINNLESTHMNKIEIHELAKYRYVRFNANGAKSFLAKLAFFDRNMNLLDGEIIKENNVELIWETGAYDDDPLSISGGENFTLGLKFDEPKVIGYVTFQARNDDNHINVGEEYELFYWNKVWKSLGKQAAKDTLLYYDVPENSLLWLRNLTKGKEEHVFIIDENIKQKWLGFDNY